MWAWVVRAIGGVYERGKHCLLIHDRGALYAYDSVIRWEWNCY